MTHPVINPNDAAWTNRAFLMWAGAHGNTKAYIYANDFEAAFEHFVEWLDKAAPGLLSKSWKVAKDFDMTLEELEAGEEIPDHTMIGHTTLHNGDCIASHEWGGDEIDRSEVPLAVASFDRFALEMSYDQAHSVSHAGDCEPQADALRTELAAQLTKISDADLRSVLAEYGAWDDDELADRAANESRIVWIAGGNIVEEC